MGTYYCHALAHRCWEAGSIRIDDTTWRERVLVLLGKIKEPVLILWSVIEVSISQCKTVDEGGSTNPETSKTKALSVDTRLPKV